MRDITGLELTPKEFKDLLIELFDGTQFKRKVAIDKICEYWEEHGGIISNKDYVGVFKSACRMLEKEGISNKSYGVWTLKYAKKEVVKIESSLKAEKKQYMVEKEIGDGNNAIYLYYFKTYKEFALSKEEDIYACKIGRTDVDPIQRIYSQMGTCFPEKPHIALVIKCEDSVEMERAIHHILKCRKRQIIDSPGKEWFMTNPYEVEMIYNFIKEQ